jgi:uncharacterized RDD family membrane protein YckC
MESKPEIIPNMVPDYIEERDVLGQIRTKRIDFKRLKFKSSKAPDLNVEYAGLGARTIATLIDFTIVIGVLLILWKLLFTLNYINNDFNEYSFIIGFFVWIFYNGLFDGSVNQGTIGKKILNIKVIDIYGKKMNPFWAIIRSITTIISVLPIGLGVWYLETDPKKQSWHDLISGSYVIKS